MTSLIWDHVSVRIGSADLLQPTSLTLKPGLFYAVLGPNGAGKSTLLRAMLGLVETSTGTCRFGNEDIHHMAPFERARLISYLPQLQTRLPRITTRHAILLGGHACGVSPYRLTKKERIQFEKIITETQTGDLLERTITSLSGGEQARIHCARMLMANARFLLADEPEQHLDPQQKWSVLNLLKRQCSNEKAVLAVLHDPNLATRFADHIVWMKNGRIITQGPTDEMLTTHWLEEIYEIPLTVDETSPARSICWPEG